MLREKPLHAGVKRWYAEDGDRIEVPIGGYVIDLVRGDLLIEVQTRGLLRDAGQARRAARRRVRRARRPSDRRRPLDPAGRRRRHTAVPPSVAQARRADRPRPRAGELPRAPGPPPVRDRGPADRGGGAPTPRSRPVLAPPRLDGRRAPPGRGDRSGHARRRGGPQGPAARRPAGPVHDRRPRRAVAHGPRRWHASSPTASARSGSSRPPASAAIPSSTGCRPTRGERLTVAGPRWVETRRPRATWPLRSFSRAAGPARR